MDERYDRLAAWLAPRLGAQGPVTIEDPHHPGAIGYSAETVLFTAVFDDGDSPCTRRLVLRSETPDPAIYPQQAPGLDVEIDIQRRLMQAVAQNSAVPVAAILGAEPDPATIGTPFFVMEFVDGVVPPVDPSYAVKGFFADATPDQRGAMIRDGLRVLAEIHSIDWQAAGLDWLVPPGATPSLAHQLEVWEAHGRRELGDRHHPSFERGLKVLHAHLPTGSAPGLCWGDPRPGNMIWRDFRCVCVTDWEAASIAPPEVDLGWWLMFDRTCHEVVGAPRLEGEPTREEQRLAYEAAAQRDVGPARLYELFAAVRYAAIVVRVMNRAVERGHLPPDQTIWLENPAVTALDQILDE